MRDVQLTAQILASHARSDGTYGAPRIRQDLRDVGARVGQKRVARLMAHAAIRGVSRRRFVTTTQRATTALPVPDLVQRDFTAAAPNQLWVADITYVPTWAGFLYLAVVLDAFSRWIVGWAMASASSDRVGGTGARDGARAAAADLRHSSLGPWSARWIQPVVATLGW